MADTITQSSVVQITLVDAIGNRQSFNIDNPKSNISMNQIKAALSPAILSGYWYSKSAEQFVAVNSATVTESKKIKLDNSDVVIEVTPASLNFDASQATPSGTVTVEGATVVGAYVSQIVTSAPNATMYATTSGQTVTVQANFPAGSPAGTTATLYIVTDARTVTVPISVS